MAPLHARQVAPHSCPLLLRLPISYPFHLTTPQVLRTHFHDFMLDVHAQLHTRRSEADPLLGVADHVAARCRVLALDELFVNDVADAAILNRWEGRIIVYCK